ncbi:alpha/beta hydrolase family protein [Alicyclobacillus ferrooxydans]|uniref:BD-FAE-like domain-containing protein n=1 Tax=Alicyclobacillus ferrooxydans TaxID=471514 RepID=A0A0P9CG84_9BACL|nr:alpha/beta hydrolase [Alicyclobacillus ferrooxydans]KPV44569.1 hypothetical protein AN477_06095 [Alicyclobacillus ferrooxydans]
MNEIRIPYGSQPSQFGELRIPSGPGPHPVVIVIHGGFWYDRYGLDLMHAVSDVLTARGYATWNIEYRRVGEDGGGWPETLIDVGNAADHLKVLAQKYELDLSRVVTMGHSAGGHLALWSAARHKSAAFLEQHAGVSQMGSPETDTSPESPLRIHGAISLAGVNDLRLMWEIRQEQSPVVDFLGGIPSVFPNRYAAASPMELLPLGLPQVLVHGTDDDRVPLQISEHYYNAAMEMGDPVTMIELPGVEHFKLIQPTSEAWPPIVTALDELFAAIESNPSSALNRSES